MEIIKMMTIVISLVVAANAYAWEDKITGEAKGVVSTKFIKPHLTFYDFCTKHSQALLERIIFDLKCPRCEYVRTAEDIAPEWQCPVCQVAYAKISSMAENQEFTPLSDRSEKIQYQAKEIHRGQVSKGNP